jgi:predicted RNase H-like nuclease (RuvC/YqgF family)
VLENESIEQLERQVQDLQMQRSKLQKKLEDRNATIQELKDALAVAKKESQFKDQRI